jgi:hypothetical protein
MLVIQPGSRQVLFRKNKMIKKAQNGRRGAQSLRFFPGSRLRMASATWASHL